MLYTTCTYMCYIYAHCIVYICIDMFSAVHTTDYMLYYMASCCITYIIHIYIYIFFFYVYTIS